MLYNASEMEVILFDSRDFITASEEEEESQVSDSGANTEVGFGEIV